MESIIKEVNVSYKYVNNIIENACICITLKDSKDYVYIPEYEFATIEYNISKSLFPYLIDVLITKTNTNKYKFNVLFLGYYSDVNEILDQLEKIIVNIIDYNYSIPCKKIKK